MIVPWLPVLSVGYVGLLVLSFATRQWTCRWIIRIVTAVLTPFLLPISLLELFLFAFFKEPPTLADLQRTFLSKRADLQTILRMSDEDVSFYRIAPDFLDRTSMHTNTLVRYRAGDAEAALPETRWDAYRKIYSRSGIKLGILRNDARDAFIMVDSVGILNRGHTSGYLYCSPIAPANENRFKPCTLGQKKGAHEYDPKSREEGYSLQKLDDRWYAYDEGPS